MKKYIIYKYKACRVYQHYTAILLEIDDDERTIDGYWIHTDLFINVYSRFNSDKPTVKPKDRSEYFLRLLLEYLNPSKVSFEYDQYIQDVNDCIRELERLGRFTGINKYSLSSKPIVFNKRTIELLSRYFMKDAVMILPYVSDVACMNTEIANYGMRKLELNGERW